ncbi:MAG: Mpo1-like protein [Rhodanobacteraceae bacterium]
MRNVNDWFASYSSDHLNPVNRAIHWVCVPAILWAVIALLWVIPVSPSIGRPGFWCALVMVAAMAFYWRLSRPIAAAMFVVLVLLGLATDTLYRSLGTRALLWLAVTVFALAWVGQFIGHAIEGRRPSFATDLTYLLIGPAWLAGKLLARFGVAC